MKDQLVSFETAKLAKEKGFDLLTEYYYYNGKEGYATKQGINKARPLNRNIYDFQYTAPTQSLLQKWLREKHKIEFGIEALYNGDYGINFYTVKNGKLANEKKWSDLLDHIYKFDVFKIYEEAFEVALQEALKLIKL